MLIKVKSKDKRRCDRERQAALIRTYIGICDKDIKLLSDMPPKKKGNEIEIREPKIDKNPFKLAANDFKSEFDALLAADDTLDINATDEFGFSPLLWSVKNGHEDMATYLLSKGAAIESAGIGGMRGLHLASANVRENLVAVLLEHGAEPDGLDDAGNTAMHWAAVRGILNIVIRLLAKGADPNVKNKQGVTVDSWPTPRPLLVFCNRLQLALHAQPFYELSVYTRVRYFIPWAVLRCDFKFISSSFLFALSDRAVGPGHAQGSSAGASGVHQKAARGQGRRERGRRRGQHRAPLGGADWLRAGKKKDTLKPPAVFLFCPDATDAPNSSCRR